MTIVHALAHDALVVMECIDKKTGEEVVCLCGALCETSTEEGATVDNLRFLPLARLFEGDPFSEIVVPKGNTRQVNESNAEESN